MQFRNVDGRISRLENREKFGRVIGSRAHLLHKIQFVQLRFSSMIHCPLLFCVCLANRGNVILGNIKAANIFCLCTRLNISRLRSRKIRRSPSLMYLSIGKTVGQVASRFTILELPNPSCVVPELYKIVDPRIFEALKMLKGLVGSKETTLERAIFQAGWSQLSWSGRALPVLA